MAQSSCADGVAQRIRVATSIAPGFSALHKIVRITFDPAKRDATLRDRGLDFADAAEVFAGDHTVADRPAG